MKHNLLIIIALFCVSVAAAEITVQQTTVVEDVIEPVFSVADGEVLTITSRLDMEQTSIFIDGEFIQTIPSITANEPVTIMASIGEHTVDIRSINTYTYEWSDFEITQNDEPIFLDYLNYDRSDDRVRFALKSQYNIIHPQDIDTMEDSYRESLEDYVVSLNGAGALNCYPKVSTGKPVQFSCSVSTYPEAISIEATLGIKEQIKAVVATPVTQPAIKNSVSEVLQGPPTPPPVPEQQTLPENIPSIEMTDSIKDTPAGIPVTIFILLMFLSFFVILFIASHHNYENKQAGTHHKVRRKQEK